MVRVDREELYEGAIKRFEEIWPDVDDRMIDLSFLIESQIQLNNHFRPNREGSWIERIGEEMHRSLVYGWGQEIFSFKDGDLLRERILLKLMGLVKKEGKYEIISDLTEEDRGIQREVYREFCEIYDELPEDNDFEDVVKKAKKDRWVPGAEGAKRFCRLTGFDDFFAGERTESAPGHYDILPWIEYPPMRPYQENISALMNGILESEDPRGRQGIMVMPTGSGKTRVAVETLLRWYLSREDAPLIVWLCHRNELCDQASGSFESVWNRISIDGTDNPHGRSLRVYRFWDNIWTDPKDGQEINRIDREKGGVAIVSIQTLQKITAEDTAHHTAVRERLMAPECIIVDEVHRFETRGYRGALSGIGVDVRLTSDFGETRIGLTATPWRSDPDEQRRMYTRWGNRFLLEGLVGRRPGADEVELALNDLRSSLQGEDILAKPNYYTLTLPNSNRRVRVNQFNELTRNQRDELADDRERNLAILATVEWLRRERGRKSILLFGMTKNHGQLMSVELNSRGIPAASVDAETKSGTRRRIVAKFRTGELEVLCNHSIFTTGFDAPNTDAIVICRPIRSKTLLDQIFGRGLRGTEFGGTEDCDIVVPDYRFTFTNGQTRRLDTYAVPQEEIEKMLGAEMEEVPSEE